MKIIKSLPLISILLLYSSNSIAETKKDCSSIEADTGVKMYEKLKCKIDNSSSESIGKKLKNIFKRKD